MAKPFKFKEFTVEQDKAAMKVGTDGVLLGAWCTVENYPNSILDVGTGTGVIALLLAQRSDAITIDAVEIDEGAYEQAVENFEQSDWGDRLYCYHATLQEFGEELQAEHETYDLIVSNPPFYTENYTTPDQSRNKARFTLALSFEDLLSSVTKILSKKGNFAVIIPFREEEDFIILAGKYKLFLNKICRVQGNPKSEIKRSLLEFSFLKKPIKEAHLIIENARHVYTEAYKKLTKDFYLKM